MTSHGYERTVRGLSLTPLVPITLCQSFRPETSSPTPYFFNPLPFSWINPILLILRPDPFSSYGPSFFLLFHFSLAALFPHFYTLYCFTPFPSFFVIPNLLLFPSLFSSHTPLFFYLYSLPYLSLFPFYNPLLLGIPLFTPVSFLSPVSRYLSLPSSLLPFLLFFSVFVSSSLLSRFMRLQQDSYKWRLDPGKYVWRIPWRIRPVLSSH